MCAPGAPPSVTATRIDVKLSEIGTVDGHSDRLRSFDSIFWSLAQGGCGNRCCNDVAAPGPLDLATSELESSDACVPVESTTASQVLGCVPERTIVRWVDCQRAVVAPAIQA